MLSLKALGAITLAAMFAPSFASGQVLFSDPGESLSQFTVIKDSVSTDSTVAGNVDYAALGIPEAPHRLAGSASQRGIQIFANKGDATGAATGLNLLLGATPLTFTGTHTLQFDVWMNVDSPGGSTTEGIIAGTARSTATDAILRTYRTSRGNGAWIYMNGDNGNLSDDFAQLNNGSRDVVFSDTTDAASTAKFNTAFKNTITPGAANDADNEWVQVSIVQDGSTASVYMNGVLFSTNTSTNTSGFAWLGYEDEFNSLGTPGLYGLFDNIAVTQGNAVPEPAGLTVVGLGLVALARRRNRR